jgi:hypothetical protein
MGLRERAIILIKALQPVKRPPSETSLLESIARGTTVVSSGRKFFGLRYPCYPIFITSNTTAVTPTGWRSSRRGTFMQPARPHALSYSLVSMIVLVGPREASV